MAGSLPAGSDDRWRPFLEGLFDPHVVLEPIRDATGRVVDLACVAVNRAACADLLRGREALIGVRFLELVAGDAASGLFERYLHVLVSGDPLALDDIELRVGPEAPPRRMDIRAVGIDGALLASWRDVTDRWRERQALAEARRDLAESERRYRVIAEQSSDFVYEIGPDMRIRWASPSTEALIGWAPDELVGRTPMDLFPPEGFAESRGLVARSLAGESVAGRRRLRRRDGSDHWFFRTARPVRDDDGVVERVIAGFRDIQAEVEAEEALAASELRYRLIADNASDIVFLSRPDGSVEWISPSVTEVLGWSTEDVVGRRTLDFVHPDDVPMVATSGRDINEGRPAVLEFRLRAKDGSYRWFGGNGRPLMDADGHVIGRTGAMHDVTARHEAVEALAASELRFRETVDQMLDPLVMLQPVRDADGTITDFTYTYANPAACAFYGRDRDAIVGHRVGALFPGLVHEGWIDTYASIVGTGEPFRADGLMVPGDGGPGTERYTDKRAYALGNGLVSTWRDVTTNRRAEAALREAETRYRLLLDSAADIVVLTDPDAVVTWVSPSVRTILGWDPEELVGRRVQDLVHPEELTVWIRRRSEIDASGRAAYEARYLQADGDYRWMSVATTVVHDESGDIVARTGIFRDITAEHAAREALERSRQELAEAQRLAHVGSWSVDLSTHEIAWSAELYRIAGLEPAPGGPALEVQRRLHDPDTLERIEAGVRDAWRLGVGFEVAGDLQPADGGPSRHLITRGEPVIGRDGSVVRVRGTTADVTELTEATRRIQELNEGLEQRVQERTAELETFTYTLSHDLRAPLRWINGFAAMLQRRDGDRLDETSRHYLDEIRNASDRMGRLFEELLDYSRLGRQTVRSETIDWTSLLAGTRATFSPRMATSGAALEIAEPLAPVRADPMLLDRAIANLVDNALTYTAPGVPARVTVRAVRHGALVRVSVSDQGIGIPADQQERIFQPFVRLHDADEYPGTGIGLAIVHRAIGLMGAEVRLESVVGRGTTFWFELPAAG